MIPDGAPARSLPEWGQRSWKGVVAWVFLTTLLAGCGTDYLNEADRNPKYRTETDFASSRSAEVTYRRIYTMLYRCTSGYYRVQGSYDPASRHAEISVDTGVGFENDLYLADSHVMSAAGIKSSTR